MNRIHPTEARDFVMKLIAFDSTNAAKRFSELCVTKPTAIHWVIQDQDEKREIEERKIRFPCGCGGTLFEYTNEIEFYGYRIKNMFKQKNFSDHIVDYHHIEKTGVFNHYKTYPAIERLERMRLDTGFGIMKFSKPSLSALFSESKIFFSHNSTQFYISDKAWKVMREVIPYDDLQLYKTLLIDGYHKNMVEVRRRLAQSNFPQDLVNIILQYYF
jgi:hypothetical protein